MTDFRIRQLSADDWMDYKDLRLESLREEPGHFLPSSDETKFSPEDWRARLGNSNAATFAVYHLDQIVGVSAVFIDKSEGLGDTAQFVGSYLRKEFRGFGLSKLFYDARLSWAREKGLKKVRLEHREDNELSFRAHRRFGFKKVGSVMDQWPDGATCPSLIFELEI